VENSPEACITLITLSLGFAGASTLTSAQNPQDLAPNFAGSVFGFTNFFATCSGFISPLVVSYFTRENVSEKLFYWFREVYQQSCNFQSTMNEWRNVFILDGTLYILSAIFFMIFGSGEVQKWNKRDSYKDLMKI
jgi:MFS transporter, ACS family, solute carrier family 17 (sodium-dependent inorganic phosphate cotransporter), other